MSDLGPEARSILDGGRDGDDPTPADRARIRGSVMRAIAAGGAATTAAAMTEAAVAAKAAQGIALGWKILAGLLITGAVGGGAALALRHEAPAAPALVTSGSPPAQAASASPPPEETTPPSAPLAPASTTPTVASARPASPPPERRIEPSKEPAPPALEEPSPSAAVAPPTPPADTLTDETRRLREAHGALTGGDPARALSLLDEQAAAGAQLREERSAARILALCQLGRVDEARVAAARFLAESPRSPLADRVRASCAVR